MLKSSKHVKGSVMEEKQKFPDVIMNITQMFEISPDTDERLREILIQKDDVIVMLVNYMQYWKAKKANR